MLLRMTFFLSFFFTLKFFFLSFWLCGVFVALHGFSLVAVSGSYSSLEDAGFSFLCFSYHRAQALGAWASVVVARGLSSCGPWAELLCGKWDLPGPEIEPVSPALVGRFPSTSPPGKSYIILFNG